MGKNFAWQRTKGESPRTGMTGAYTSWSGGVKVYRPFVRLYSDRFEYREERLAARPTKALAEADALARWDAITEPG